DAGDGRLRVHRLPARDGGLARHPRGRPHRQGHDAGRPPPPAGERAAGVPQGELQPRRARGRDSRRHRAPGPRRPGLASARLSRTPSPRTPFTRAASKLIPPGAGPRIAPAREARMPEKRPSLNVLSGPLAGSVFVLEDAVDNILIGSDSTCQFVIDAPGVSPIHARLWVDLNGATVYDTNSPAGVYVNDDRVVKEAAVRNGDILWLGPPGEEGSVLIQCILPAPAAGVTAAPDAATAREAGQDGPAA